MKHVKKYLVATVAGLALLAGAGYQSANAQEVRTVQASSAIDHPVIHTTVGADVNLKVLSQSSVVYFELFNYSGTWSISSPAGILRNHAYGDCAVYAYDSNNNLTDTFYVRTW